MLTMLTKSIGKLAIASTLLAGGFALQAQAASVNPDVIFGTGNGNGSFTINNLAGEGGNVEIGLRAKQRFPAAGIYNYDGIDTYTFQAGRAPNGNPTTSRPLWNFEWSINTDLSGQSGTKLSDLTYNLRLDSDPSAIASFGPAYDPINVLYADHAIGDNATGNGGGAVAPKFGGIVTAASVGIYTDLINNNNVAQNSWSMHWFSPLFDPTVAGTYRIILDAFDPNGGLFASSGINVVVSAVPLPPSMVLFGAAIIGLGVMTRRRKQKAGKAQAA